MINTANSISRSLRKYDVPFCRQASVRRRIRSEKAVKNKEFIYYVRT